MRILRLVATAALIALAVLSLSGQASRPKPCPKPGKLCKKDTCTACRNRKEALKTREWWCQRMKRRKTWQAAYENLRDTPNGWGHTADEGFAKAQRRACEDTMKALGRDPAACAKVNDPKDCTLVAMSTDPATCKIDPCQKATFKRQVCDPVFRSSLAHEHYHEKYCAAGFVRLTAAIKACERDFPQRTQINEREQCIARAHAHDLGAEESEAHAAELLEFDRQLRKWAKGCKIEPSCTLSPEDKHVLKELLKRADRAAKLLGGKP